MRHLSLLYLLAMACLGYLSCQREISFDQSSISEGRFLRGPSGECDSVHTGGNYTAQQLLDQSNVMDVTVVVTQPGSYSIYSDTVNGYYFQRTGSFSSAGTFNVRLSGNGTPARPGTDHFTLFYGSSTCVTTVETAKETGSAAVITLTGEPGPCMDPRPFGVQIQGVTTDSANGISLRVMVNEPGKWAIHIPSVNGIGYSGEGTLMRAGDTSLNLYATGTPVDAGNFSYLATIGGSSCNFEVVVRQPVAATGADYFPLAQGNRWTYNYFSYTNDSLVRSISGTASFDGSTYFVMREKNPFLPQEDLYFRRSGNSFIEYGSLDRYTKAFAYVPGTVGEIPFLRDAYPAGTYWESPAYSAMAGFGQLIQLQYKYYCIAADAGVEINGMAFRNVMKVRMYVIVGSETSPGGSSGEVYDSWYAKGIGLIYMKKMNYQAVVFEQKIRSWIIN